MGCLRTLCEYETPRIVRIRSYKASIANRLIQILIIAYVIGWVFVIQRGYQDSEEVLSSVTTKVKGASLAGNAVYDSADYVIPPQEPNSFFIMTNFLLTENQTQGTCVQDPTVSPCDSDLNCTRGEMDTEGEGVYTGRCVLGEEFLTRSCEVRSWCPLETNSPAPRPAVLLNAENFTVLIKNNVQFPKFRFFKRNIAAGNASALRSCRFDAERDPRCPIFRIGDIVTGAGEDFAQMAAEGGVMGVMVAWNCDLDVSWERCLPSYSFRRLDSRSVNDTVSPGYNFRFAKYFRESGRDSRTLVKAFGIRFVVQVYGRGGKFDIIPTMMNVGSGIALLGVATALCDVFVLYVLKRREFYWEKKYKMAAEEVNGDHTPVLSLDS